MSEGLGTLCRAARAAGGCSSQRCVPLGKEISHRHHPRPGIPEALSMAPAGLGRAHGFARDERLSDWPVTRKIRAGPPMEIHGLPIRR
jgi:hypothetical protein